MRAMTARTVEHGPGDSVTEYDEISVGATSSSAC